MILPKLAFMWPEIVVRLVDGNYKSSQSPGVFRRRLTSSEYGCVEVFDGGGGGGRGAESLPTKRKKSPNSCESLMYKTKTRGW